MQQFNQTFLILGGYGNVGSVVSRDLLQSGYTIGVAGRNPDKIHTFITSCDSIYTEHLRACPVDLGDIPALTALITQYDVIVNCLDFAFNPTIMPIAIAAGKIYTDLGDSYDGIIHAHTSADLCTDALVCLGSGSSPGITNMMVKHICASKPHVQEVRMSFCDIVHSNSGKHVLPFNFRTVVDEVTSDALIYEAGQHTFVPGSTEAFDIDFGPIYGTQHLYSTAHDESYSMPLYLRDKGLQKFRYVMAHDPLVMHFTLGAKAFGLLSETPREIEKQMVRPYHVVHSVMSDLMPADFSTDDQEILRVRVDDTVMQIENHSVAGMPAGVINTGIGCSLIAQYIATHEIPAGMYHPEDIVDPQWIFDELSKRGFVMKVMTLPK